MVDYSCPNLGYDTNLEHNYPCALSGRNGFSCFEEDYLKCPAYKTSKLEQEILEGKKDE
jgi:hypothetical protein